MSNESYLRAARVTLARPVSPTSFFGQFIPNATVITEHKITFKITKTLKKEPNKTEVVIINLNAASRAEFARLPMYLRLDAGYESTGLERIFEGDVRWAFSQHNGTEWETKIEAGDGERAFKFAQISKSFKGGTDAKTMVTELAKTMGLKMPSNVAEAKSLAKKFASGVSMSGDSRVEMSRILKPQGLGWSVQDGRLQILGKGTLEGTALVLSEETGIIGEPDYGAPAKPGALPILKIKHTLYPALTPGRKIKPIARGITGLFRVSQVTHTGDTFGAGDAWMSEVEATPL